MRYVNQGVTAACTIVLVIGLIPIAWADDDPTISFQFNLGVVTVSISGIESEDLYADETKAMLQRAAQLATFSVKQLKWQKNFPKCVRREKNESTNASEEVTTRLYGRCVEWEQ